MKTWDSESIRKQFAFTAAAAENYAKELSGRITRDPKGQSDNVREIHDEYLAKWYVYDSLSFSSCLESREGFLAEVRCRLASPFDYRATGAFSRDNFEKHWRQYMCALLKGYDAA